MTLPVLRLQGTPFEPGRAHGEALRADIEHNLAVYFERFQREGKLDRAEVLARAGRYLAAIERQNPDYHEGVRGVADGSGFSLGEIAALNVRYEILYYQFGVVAMADGCTLFALSPEATDNGHLVIGQNWDWIPQVRGAVLHTTEPDGLETLSFTQAGIVGGKIGLNSVGLGLAINGLTTTVDDWSRLARPFHVRCYEILRSRDLDGALGIISNEARSCSTSFLVAQAPGRVANVEAAPDGVRVLDLEDGCLSHTNHFLDPGARGVAEPPNERRPHSYHRQGRMLDLLRGKRPLSIADVQERMRDHDGFPDSICRHSNENDPPEEHYRTVTSVVMDLDERVMHISDGPPCENAYQTIRLV